MWYSIGMEVTKAPPDEISRPADIHIPSQPFLTALVHIFPHLYRHIKPRYDLAIFYKHIIVSIHYEHCLIQ